MSRDDEDQSVVSGISSRAGWRARGHEIWGAHGDAWSRAAGCRHSSDGAGFGRAEPADARSGAAHSAEPARGIHRRPAITPTHRAARSPDGPAQLRVVSHRQRPRDAQSDRTVGARTPGCVVRGAERERARAARIVAQEDCRRAGAPPRRPPGIQQDAAVKRFAYLIAVALLLSGLVHLGILVATGGTWEGPLSWRKPAVFGLSFGLTLLTIAWVSSFVQLRERTRSILLGAFTAACVLETALVSLQTWRGVPSHFNVETPFDALVTRALAGGGAALVVIIVALTLASFRRNTATPAAMRLALRTGFLILCVAMATGGVMIARGMTLVFSGDAAGAYATGGALKPMHAVTMHAILVLPALAWLLSRSAVNEKRQIGIVRLACLAYIVIASAVAIGNIVILGTTS